MRRKLVRCKRYPNLFRDEISGTYFFRKYSKIKGKQFFRSTGEKGSEARAYKLGVDMFNEWLGRVTDQAGVVYFGKYAKRYLAQKLANPKLAENTKRNFQNQLEAAPRSSGRIEATRPRLLDAFGHLPIERISNETWRNWNHEVLATRPGYKFFNARKTLLEILNDAQENGYLQRVPKLDLLDGEAAPPRELSPEEIQKLFKAAHLVVMVGHRKTDLHPHRDERGFVVRRKHWLKLLMLIIWKQGARPGEILQYEWAMVRFDEGPTGKIHIPGRITKTRRPRAIQLNPTVSRVLRFLRQRAPEAIFLFPSKETPTQPIRAYQKSWERLCERAGVDAQMYWFRDTFVSRKLREGVSTIFIGQYIDSSGSMLERKYAVLGAEAQERVAK